MDLKAIIAACLIILRDFHCSKGPHGPIGSWDVSGVTDMMIVFRSASSFNGDLSKWDVSKVKDMRGMFQNAKAFKQTLCGAWRISNAKKDKMFEGSPGKICDGRGVSVRP